MPSRRVADVGNRFADDTAVNPVACATGEGVDCYDGLIDPGWFLARGPGGGYVAAIMLRALAESVGDATRAPKAFTAHFTETAEPGPVRVAVTNVRTGKSVTTLEARMLQDDRTIAIAIAAFSASRPTLEFCDLRMPDVAAPEDCPGTPPMPPTESLLDRYEFRWAIGDTPFSRSGVARCGGWVRLAEPMRPDAALIAAYTDGWPHALFSRIGPEAGIAAVPTVDLTIHFRERMPLPGARDDDYCLVVFRTDVAADGFVEEDAQVWSREGVLLAQSRSLGRIVLTG